MAINPKKPQARSPAKTASASCRLAAPESDRGVASAPGQPGALAHSVVGFEQLLVVADVEPLAAEAVAVDRRSPVEPGHEVARGIRRVPLAEVLVEQP